jgi:hypothetical protein
VPLSAPACSGLPSRGNLELGEILNYFASGAVGTIYLLARRSYHAMPSRQTVVPTAVTTNSTFTRLRLSAMIAP